MATADNRRRSSRRFSEMTTSAKTELIATTLNNVRSWRTKPQSKKSVVNMGSQQLGEFEDVGDFVAFWLTTFQNLFLIPRTNSDDVCEVFESDDDICYIVEKITDENGCLEALLNVKRFTDIRSVDNLHNVSTSLVDWEETTYINLLTHLCRFKLCCGILEKEDTSVTSHPSSPNDSCQSNSAKIPKFHIKDHFIITTYASPFQHRIDKKSSRNVLTYPILYFLIDEYESVWEKVVLLPNQDFCVELVAELDGKLINLYSNLVSAAASKDESNQRPPQPPPPSELCDLNQTSVFLGASSYSVIKRVFLKKRKQSSIGLLSSLFSSKKDASSSIEFINMIGPNKVGKAQVAVNQVAAAGSLPTRNRLRSNDSNASNGAHFDSNSKREDDLGLHCRITYIAVPSQHIIKMIFESPKMPSELSLPPS